MEARFTQVTAVVVLSLGLVAIDGGLNLVGSPFSFASTVEGWIATSTEETTPEPVAQQPMATKADPLPVQGAARPVASNQLTINVRDGSYEPRVSKAKAGQPVTLALVTNETYGCTSAFVIPALGVQRILPETGTTLIELPAQPKGTLRYTCSMGMYSGRIQFE